MDKKYAQQRIYIEQLEAENYRLNLENRQVKRERDSAATRAVAAERALYPQPPAVGLPPLYPVQAEHVTLANGRNVIRLTGLDGQLMYTASTVEEAKDKGLRILRQSDPDTAYAEVIVRW